MKSTILTLSSCEHINSIQFYFIYIILLINPCFLRNQFNTTPTFPQQAQWNPSSVSVNEFEMGGDMSGAGSSGQAPKVNNHQKTSERMCEDESKFSKF